MLDLGTSFLAPPDKLLKLGRSSESTGALKFEFQLSLIFFSTSSILFWMTPFRFVRSFVCSDDNDRLRLRLRLRLQRPFEFPTHCSAN